MVVAPEGHLFISDNQKRMIFRADAGGGLEEFCGRYRDGSRLRGPNEIALGPNGRLYFTDPGGAWRGRPEGALSRVDRSGRAELLAEGLEFTNGLDFTPDGREICLVETTTGRVLRAALADDGTLAEPLREFVRFEGSVGPDGIRFAASGNLYVTLFGRGQVAVVSPEGRVIDRLRVPGLFPTNVIFAGRSLLVCEGQTGAIWKLDVGEEGVPPILRRSGSSHEATRSGTAGCRLRNSGYGKRFPGKPGDGPCSSRRSPVGRRPVPPSSRRHP